MTQLFIRLIKPGVLVRALANKPLIGSAVLILMGIILRLNAHSMSWPRGRYSYSGPASETIWARQETAIAQIAMAVMFAGILIFAGTYFYWLFDKKAG